MKDQLIGALIILLLCSPFILIVLLIIKIRRRKKREALGLSEKVDYSFDELIGPFSLKENQATCALLLILAVIFVGELFFALKSGLAFTPTLLALGASSHSTVIATSEWHRLFTATFLHGGVLHLLLNCLALFFAGRILEKQISSRWFLAIYFLGGLGGSLFSVAINDKDILSVGASGAIMGLFAAIMAVSFHTANKEKRHALRLFSLRVIIPALIPHSTQGGMQIDYAGHFGGLVGGGLAAFIMLMSWPADSVFPRLRGLALAVAALGIITTVLSFSRVALLYPTYAAVGKYGEICRNTLKEHAEKNGVNAEKYIKENEEYLRTCIKFHIENNGGQ